MKHRATMVAALLSMILFGICAAQAEEVLTTYADQDETKAQKDARLQWWREAKFGMFIHWGVYSVPAGTYKGEKIGGIGEWIMQRARIPVKEYKAFAREFNPVKYDPDEWVRMAKNAGMKYIVITSKHHDGFALFDSRVSDWNIVDATPYGKDLLKPLSEACKKQGIKLGFYYSEAQDWTNPGGAKAGYKEGDGWDDAQKGDFDDYLRRVAVPQVGEILSNYGDLGILWWDTPVWMTKERADLLLPLIRLQPGIIVNNRLGGGYRGDYGTPEQHIPATGLDYDWETCMTMNGTWGYKSYDDNWKSSQTLIRNLVDIVSKGGNYLLNVGPKSDGTFPQASIDRLEQIGVWMDQNGESIYDTTASPTRRPEWGRISKRIEGDGATLYLHVFDWPEDGKLPVAVKNDAGACYLLADKDRTFEVETGDEGATVQLTGDAPDPIDSVVVLKVKGEPDEIPFFITQKDDGTVELDPSYAELNGELRVEQKDGKNNIGFWTKPSETATWTFKLKKAGTYDVVSEIATPSASTFAIEVDGSRIETHVEPTGDYDQFRETILGGIKLDETGKMTLTVKPAANAWSAVNMRAIVLKPAK